MLARPQRPVPGDSDPQPPAQALEQGSLALAETMLPQSHREPERRRAEATRRRPCCAPQLVARKATMSSQLVRDDPVPAPDAPEAISGDGVERSVGTRRGWPLLLRDRLL